MLAPRAESFTISRDMSAKHSKKSAKRETVTPKADPIPPATPVPATASAAAAEPAPAWIDSTDPRKRTIGKIVLVGVWLYVAALWLLALDQTFHWGIFGPKIPPVP
jgi:hypothetical protein